MLAFADISANARLQGLQEEVLDDSDTNCESEWYVYCENRLLLRLHRSLLLLHHLHYLLCK